jgi:transposase
VRTRTGYIAVVRSLLRQHGWRVRPGAPETLSRRVRELPLPGRVLSEVAPLLAVMRHVNQQLAYSDERVETITATDARVRRLRTMPGVGAVTAAAFVAAIDDVTRFRRAHELSGAPRPRPPRTQFGGHPAPRAHHQGGAGSRAPPARPGDRLHAPLPAPAHRGLARVDPAHRDPARLARRLAGILFAMLRDGARRTAHAVRARRTTEPRQPPSRRYKERPPYRMDQERDGTPRRVTVWWECVSRRGRSTRAVA